MNKLGMILGRISPSLCIQHTEMGLGHRNGNHSRENQHNISSGPPNWQRKNARGTSVLGESWGGIEEIGQDTEVSEIVIGGAQRRW
ncbi:hypothetical protein E2C01_066880 [Portunus trituberculatus]|uniref:Uncharacterized protein n=1 Tax=Portunus trituberculatus TaxID=210409 RepID=A0A5B7HV28_PORTR|nr:hypothetical protein [Portunus trituberculatus]